MACEEFFRVSMSEAAEAMRALALAGVDYRYMDNEITQERIFYTRCDLKRLAHAKFEICPNCGANSWSPKASFVQREYKYRIIAYSCDYCGTWRKNDETR